MSTGVEISTHVKLIGPLWKLGGEPVRQATQDAITELLVTGTAMAKSRLDEVIYQNRVGCCIW